MGKMSLDGMLNARAIKKVWGPYCDLKFNAGSDLNEPARNMYEIASDMNFSKLSTSMKLVYQGIWIMNGAFSQMITPNLHMGGELTYLNLHGGASMGTLGFRYSAGADTLSATLGRTPDFKNPISASPVHGLRAQYMRKISDRLSLGTEYEYSHPDHESALRIGYEYNFKNSRVQGLLDTAGKVSCYINYFQGFGFSGMIDYPNNDYRFGFLMHYFPMGDGEMEGEPMM